MDKLKISPTATQAVILLFLRQAVVIAGSIGLLFGLITRFDLQGLYQFFQSQEGATFIAAAFGLGTLAWQGWSKIKEHKVLTIFAEDPKEPLVEKRQNPKGGDTVLQLAVAMLIPLAAFVALSGCTTTDFRSYSAQAIITADAGYIAASRFGQTMVVMGSMSKERFKQLDEAAHDALRAMRAARDSVSLLRAEQNFNQTLQAFYAEK